MSTPTNLAYMCTYGRLCCLSEVRGPVKKTYNKSEVIHSENWKCIPDTFCLKDMGGLVRQRCFVSYITGHPLDAPVM